MKGQTSIARMVPMDSPLVAFLAFCEADWLGEFHLSHLNIGSACGVQGRHGAPRVGEVDPVTDGYVEEAP